MAAIVQTQIRRRRRFGSDSRIRQSSRVPRDGAADAGTDGIMAWSLTSLKRGARAPAPPLK